MSLFKQPGSENWWAYHCIGQKRYRKSMRTTVRRDAERRAQEWVRELEAKASRTQTKLSVAVDRYVQHCKDAGLAKSTIRDYQYKLIAFLKYQGDQMVEHFTPDSAFEAVRDFVQATAEGKSPETATKCRVVISGFFNWARSQRLYVGPNPADAKLHGLRRPLRPLTKERYTTKAEDIILRREGPKYRVWPIILLCRWAGLRRGEICVLRWDEVDLRQGSLIVHGHEGGRKHPRRVCLAPWVVLLLKAIKPSWTPENARVWAHHPDTANDDLVEFCKRQTLSRQIGFQDMRAAWVTESFRRGMTAEQESAIGGHSPEVARKYYSAYTAEEARPLLPPTR